MGRPPMSNRVRTSSTLAEGDALSSPFGRVGSRLRIELLRKAARRASKGLESGRADPYADTVRRGKQMYLTRRELFEVGADSVLGLSVGLVSLAVGCSMNESACVDPEFLSTPERSMRKFQSYVNRSPHGTEENCGGCQFFTGEGACGRCQILAGPVDAGGHCDAWAGIEVGKEPA